MKIVISGREFDVTPGTDRVTVDGKGYAISLRWDDRVAIVSVDGVPFRVQMPEDRGTEMTVLVDHRPVQMGVTGLSRVRPARRAAAPGADRRGVAATGKGVVTASMTGEIVEVHVKPGDRVEAGDILVILEAMKMRNEIAAPEAGTVKSVDVEPGSRVNQGAVLVVLESASD